MLFDGPTVKRAQELQREAQSNLGGVSTGLGFWGSPGWVLGGALTLGLLESAASGIAAEQGLRQLQEADAILGKVREGGRFVPVACIENVHYPSPASWRSLAVEPEQDLEKILNENKIDTFLIHTGEPFVRMKTANGKTLYIAWDKIEQYSVVLAPTLA